MRAIIATFERAEDYAQAVRERLGRPVSTGTTAAYGEAFDGHTLVVVWVPEAEAGIAQGLATAGGGLVHEAAISATQTTGAGSVSIVGHASRRSMRLLERAIVFGPESPRPDR